MRQIRYIKPELRCQWPVVQPVVELHNLAEAFVRNQKNMRGVAEFIRNDEGATQHKAHWLSVAYGVSDVYNQVPAVERSRGEYKREMRFYNPVIAFIILGAERLQPQPILIVDFRISQYK